MFVTVAFGAFVVAFAIYLSTVTLSILFAVIAVATLGPFNERLRARGWGGAKAAGGSIGAAVLIVVGALLLIGLALIPFLVDLTQYLHDGLERLSTELAAANVPADAAATLTEAVQQIEGWLSQQASAIVDSLVEAGTIVMLGLFLTFYLLLDGDKAWDVGLSGLGGWQRDRIRDAGEEAMRRAGGYVRGTAVIASVDAVVSFVVLTLIGVSLAGPLAVLVLAAGFIPYIGGLFVAGILLLAGLALGGVPTGLLLVLIVVVLKVVEQRRLASYLADRTLQLHPAVILLALLIGFTMGGLTGMFVAVPTIAVVTAITGAVLDVLGTTGTARVSVRGDIPAWLDRLAQWSWRLLVAVGLVGLAVGILSQFPVVVGPIVVAVTLAATFLPAVAALERRGWTRGRASFVVSVVVWATVSVVTVAVHHSPRRVGAGRRSRRDHRRKRRGRIPPRRCVGRRRAAVPAGGLRDPRVRRLDRQQPRPGARVLHHHGAARVLHAARWRPRMGVDHLASRRLAPDARSRSRAIGR